MKLINEDNPFALLLTDVDEDYVPQTLDIDMFPTIIRQFPWNGIYKLGASYAQVNRSELSRGYDV